MAAASLETSQILVRFCVRSAKRRVSYAAYFAVSQRQHRIRNVITYVFDGAGACLLTICLCRDSCIRMQEESIEWKFIHEFDVLIVWSSSWSAAGPVAREPED